MAKRRVRSEMIEETRAKLINSARKAFGTIGFANTSMDDLTEQAGLTRGALYHHFGDKQGLFAAVFAQVDAEMDKQLQAISDNAIDVWEAFQQRCRAYLAMSLNTEFQQIVLKDSRAILSDAAFRDAQACCVASLRGLLEELMRAKIIHSVDAEALACLINGSLLEAALWIGHGEDPEARLSKALHAFEPLLQGLKRGK